MTILNNDEALDLVAGRHGDPFARLGMHSQDGRLVVCAYIPGAETVEVLDAKSERKTDSLSPILKGEGLFAGQLKRRKRPFAYKLRAQKQGHIWTFDDPYRFGPVLGDMDAYLFNEGTHQQLWRILGSHVIEHQGVWGTHFAVWAPNASRVSVVGDFNAWNGTCHTMRRLGDTGMWEIFIPDIGEESCYKYEIIDRDGRLLPQKADPLAFGSERPPKTASIVRRIDDHKWTDSDWMSTRADRHKTTEPMSIYEVHLGSWKQCPEEDNRSLTYLEHASDLVGYVKDMGFTHLELMPISEYPFGGSWGYQPIGLFAPSSRFGTLAAFRAFVEACHAAEIGLILDWVPGHFPQDAHGLGKFDGTALYEHADSREGFHPDWNTLLFNYGRREVSNYLIANALYWMQEHHIDGLRVDAVASMLYRDYSRKDGEWIPNVHGGRENLEAISFLKRMNEAVYAAAPGAMTIAEESTAFPAVSAPTHAGGLGFGFKWNMGWMNDTLSYMSQDPIHRKYHHDKMTFGLHYAFTENFILPLSHDEVVHGKGAILEKMPGNTTDKFANMRAYFGFMWGHPGRKLLFMGSEFAQMREWSHDGSLDWHLLQSPDHRGMQSLVRDLNGLYANTPALYQRDSEPQGFAWVEQNAADESIFAWMRFGDDGNKPILVVSNFTPVERSQRRIGVPVAGEWVEKLNTDSRHYGGQDRGNLGSVPSDPIAASGHPQSICIALPPLSTLFFEFSGT